MTSPAATVRSLAGRTVVLGVTGGIAAYKAVQVARDLSLAGASVDVVLSTGALEFVRPLTFEALTGRPALTELYPPGDPLVHIRLARTADLVLVAPATANFIARAASGQADDLLTALLLATRAPVVVCPAMNDRMYAHPATTTNLERLRKLGYRQAGPDVGPLAWGEGEGEGRMIEPTTVLAHAERALGTSPLWANRRVLVTAGPTREPIDPVRFLGNRSSGRMGYAVAAAAWARGAHVTLITGPSPLPPPVGVELVRVDTAAQMYGAVGDHLPLADLLVMAAAVADFRPARVAPEKIKKGAAVPRIDLEPTPDVLASTTGHRPPGCVVVGFALETTDALAHARGKLERKDLDLIVLNQAGEPGAGFEVDTNRVTILDRSGAAEELPLLSKRQVAELLLDRVEHRFPQAPDQG